MGSASSKAARGASRKFPARSAESAASQTTRRQRASQPREADDVSKDQQETTDHDPDFTPAGFASRLQQMGIVDPHPTFSPSSRAASAHQLGGLPSSAAGPIFPASSTANATLAALAARRGVQERAEADTERFQRVGMRGAARRYVDMRTLSDALQLLDRGVPRDEVEARMGMQDGLLARLGRKGVLTHLVN